MIPEIPETTPLHQGAGCETEAAMVARANDAGAKERVDQRTRENNPSLAAAKVVIDDLEAEIRTLTFSAKIAREHLLFMARCTPNGRCGLCDKKLHKALKVLRPAHG